MIEYRYYFSDEAQTCSTFQSRKLDETECVNGNLHTKKCRLTGGTCSFLDRYDRHVGCWSYPNCDLAPLGCVLKYGDEAEQYGHKG